MDRIYLYMISCFVIFSFNSIGQNYTQPIEEISSGAENATASSYSNFGVLGNALTSENLSGGNYESYVGFLNSFKIMVGVGEKEFELSAKVFPNPAYENIYIEFSTLSSSYSYSFYDALGQIIFTKKCNDFRENINLREYSKGTYYLKIYNNEFSKTEKIIVQ